MFNNLIKKFAEYCLLFNFYIIYGKWINRERLSRNNMLKPILWNCLLLLLFIKNPMRTFHSMNIRVSGMILKMSNMLHLSNIMPTLSKANNSEIYGPFLRKWLSLSRLETSDNAKVTTKSYITNLSRFHIFYIIL